MNETVKQVIDVLMELIRLRTVAPPGENYLEIVTYLDNLLTNYGLSTRIVEVPRSIVKENYPEYADHPRYILLAELCNARDKRIHFNAHYDVVPGGNDWLVTEPFKPVLINGRIYGRGASDDKGGAAALVSLAKRLSELGDFHGCVEFSFTPDEELGGMTGVGYLIGQVRKPDYAIVAEPTGLDTVWVGSMGILQLDIVVRGLPSHASQPWYGVNAFEDGVRIAHALINDLKPRIEDRQFLGERAAITLGGFVGGGYSRNIVPNYFQFSIDRRILPNEDLETVHNELINYINTLRDGVKSAIDIYIVNRVEPALNNKSDLLGKLMNSIDHVLHVNPRVGISRVPVDTRYFQRAGVDALTYGPGNITSAHGPDEYVEIDDIIKSVDVYLRLVREIYGNA
ncbi:M20 family metallopeptidase [Vulcanisaeta sp. JCM 16161]|uniref:M20 family metallopeptidase n=1 Tax=Vulcanisaeta sp. JCM 16161 TaxID=1295372 RepID=UPI00406CB465